RTQQLLGFHCKQIAIEHRGGFLKRFRQAKRRHFHGKPSCLPDTALDLFDPLLEVAMTGMDVAPGVRDGIDWLARIIRGMKTHLRSTRAMTEAAQILDSIPAVAAQFFRFLLSF